MTGQDGIALASLCGLTPAAAPVPRSGIPPGGDQTGDDGAAHADTEGDHANHQCEHARRIGHRDREHEEETVRTPDRAAATGDKAAGSNVVRSMAQPVGADIVEV